MNTTYQIQVGRRNAITLPKPLRAEKDIADGEVMTLIELTDDEYVISRRKSRVDEVANRLAREWRDTGETLETMLAALREVWKSYGEEQD